MIHRRTSTNCLTGPVRPGILLASRHGPDRLQRWAATPRGFPGRRSRFPVGGFGL